MVKYKNRFSTTCLHILYSKKIDSPQPVSIKGFIKKIDLNHLSMLYRYIKIDPPPYESTEHGYRINRHVTTCIYGYI